MSITRERILQTIRAGGQATIAGLVEAISISHISVRHHLAALQAEGLVTASEVRHGVGRPHLAYSLTEAAIERAPAPQYVRLSGRLLDELKASMPPDGIEAMFTRMAEGIVAEYAAKLEGKSLEEKMELLVEMLGAEGFTARWNRTGETISLSEYNCPYLRLGQKHPEVCAIDQTLISQVLAANVEKTTCVLDGAGHCVYVITPGKATSIAADTISFPES